MLSKQSWIKPSDGLEFEWTQAEQEGRNLTGKEKALIQAALSAEGAEREELACLLYTSTGGPDMSILDINEAAQLITQAADPEANIIFCLLYTSRCV